MAKKPLLPAQGQFYKANLHCHSTLSDGRLTPEELKAAYKARGYSILSITDHELLVNHSDLNDPDFLTITGYEVAVNDTKDSLSPTHDWLTTRCVHINLFSSRPDYTKNPFYTPGARPADWSAQPDPADLPEQPYERHYSPEAINELVRTAHEAGFLCSYNHPCWSLETREQYAAYKGFDMMEIVNYACVMDGISEYNPYIYDEMLRAGRRLSCSATDDNHNALPLDDPRCDSFGGYIWVCAAALTYDDVMDALRYGDFYASAGGPQIRRLEWEDGTVTVEADGACEIHLATVGRRSDCRRAPKGELLGETAFAVCDDDVYFRLELIGPDGGRSYTRAYFLDELAQG